MRYISKLIVLAALLVAAQLPLPVAQADSGASQGNAAAPASGLPASLPLKRETGEGIGIEAAGFTAAGLLLLAIWAAALTRRRQVGRPGQSAVSYLPWLRKRLSPRAPRALQVVETAPLTPQVRLHVVAWQGSEYLVSTSAGAVSILDKRRVAVQDRASTEGER